MPFGTNVVLMGPAGVGKSVFCQSLIQSLHKDMHVIYVALDADPHAIRNKLQNSHLKRMETATSFTFIDGYSWLLGQANPQTGISSLCNINDLSIKIFNALTETSGHLHLIIFDSISTLFLYNSRLDIERFLQVNMARIKQSASIGLWEVSEGIHSPAFYNSLRHLADGVVELQFEEEYSLKRFIRVHTFRGQSHSTRWLPFTIKSNGEFMIQPVEPLEETPSYLMP